MMSFDPDSTALLLIDVVNDFDFEGHEKLLRHALPAAKRIAALKRRLAARGIPAVYVNDNFGQWQRDFADQTERCRAPDAKGREVTETLAPGPGDFFVLKPKHSGFYATSLPVLLESLGCRTLILTGFAGNICVLYTANDAYMRGYHLIVPSDCVASESAADNRRALDHMRTLLKARVVTSRAIR